MPRPIVGQRCRPWYGERRGRSRLDARVRHSRVSPGHRLALRWGMRHGAAFIVAAVLAAGIGPAAVEACTTFCVKTGDLVLFGRNYDFEFGRGLVVMNPARLE